jgi:hypothetical protein
MLLRTVRANALLPSKGTTIQATAWREAADALFPVFEDGKVR